MRTMKKGLCWLLMLSMILSLFTGLTFAASADPTAATPEPTPAEAFTLESGEISLDSKYKGDLTNVVIPAAIDGETVTAIAMGMFMSSDVETVVVPSTVVDIGTMAFDECDSLTAIYFYGEAPDGFGMTTDDNFSNAALYCKGKHYSSFESEGLEPNLTINNDLADPAYSTTGGGEQTEQPTEPVHTFAFELRNGAAWIKGYTGSGGEVTLPTQYVVDGETYDVVGVAANAFNTTNGSVPGVKDGASIAKITKITVPMGIKTIESGAFSSMGNVTNGKNVEEIVFEDPDTTFAHSGAAQAFHMSSNPKLRSVTLPANLTEITSSMFYGCSALESLEIPAGVSKLGARAFEGCKSLKTVTFLSATAPAAEAYRSGLGTSYPFKGCTVTLVIPADTRAAYEAAWSAMLAANVSSAGDMELREQDGGASFSYFTTAENMEYRVLTMPNGDTNGTVELKYVGKNDSGALEIPETVTHTRGGQDYTFTVVGIGEKAMGFSGFQGSGYSTSYNFSSVTFPNSLTYIAREGCAGLIRVTELDLSNTKVTTIGMNAFNNCSSVVTIKLPDTLKDIGVKDVDFDRPADGAIDTGANGLPGAGITNKNGSEADTSDELNTEVSGPEAAPAQVTENVFRGCGKLQGFVVNDTNPYFSVKDGVLFDKSGKKLIRYPVGRADAMYAIPEGTETIADAAFMMPATATATGALKTVTFPDSLQKIEDGAFRQSSITSVKLPNVEYGKYVFDCSALQSVTVTDDLTAIPEKAFWGCDELASVDLGNVTTIGVSAFERCAFTAIDLSKVTEIGDYAFYFSKLKNVTVPAATKTGKGAFMNCPDLVTATVLGDTLDPYMFFYCTSLETLAAENITTIEPFALGYCVKLAELPVGKVERIGYGAFRNCHALVNITLPATLKELGKYAFADCGGLTTVTFTDSDVTVLPEGTFYECVNLEDVYLGSSISMTEGLAFYCAGWYKGLKVNVHTDLAENLFTRNEFEACFLDLGNQQTLNESYASGGDIAYIWTRTAIVDGVKTYYFRARNAGGGCGGGCGGGGAELAEDGLTAAEFSMQPSVTVNYLYGSNTSTENLPELLTVYEQNGRNAAAEKIGSFNMAELKEKAAAHAAPQPAQPVLYSAAAYGLSDSSLPTGTAAAAPASLDTQETPVTKNTVGYQFMGMRGWSIMAATEYVTLEDLGIALEAGDTLVVTASDGASYTISYEDLMANNQFFPESKSWSEDKTDANAQTVPAILALTWNTATIDKTTTKTDGEVLEDIAKTAYRSTNFRFAHGLSFDAYSNLPTCDGMTPTEDEVCTGYRLLQKVSSFTVIHKDGTSDTTSTGGIVGKKDAETVKHDDGSVSTIETRADGSTLETRKYLNGTTVETVTSKDGEITAKVTVPSIVGSTVVDIPVEKPTTGMVAVIVNKDGTEELVRDCIVTKNGISLRVDGSLKLRVIDNTKRFTDMDGHWALDAVTFVAARELFGGVGGGRFAPAQAMTRGMVNTVLARLAGEDTSGSAPWYAKGTDWAVRSGVSDGKSPESPITREQMATMLYRFADSPKVDGELSFADADQVSAWARDAVKWCTENGILNGVSGSRLAPQALAQRAQVAAMLQRFLQVTL